jgi:hypothetical protein
MTRKPVQSKWYFYVNCLFCYDTSCQESPLDWVTDFDDVPPDSVTIVVPIDSGTAAAGVYARESVKSQWRRVVPYSSFVELCSAINSTIKIHAAVSAVTPTDPRAVLFRNALQLPEGSSLQPSQFDLWAEIIPEEADSGATPWKDADAASDGIMQVSDGTGRKVKDWAPGAEGLVKTDSQGKVSVALPGVDFALPMDLAENNFPTDMPANEGITLQLTEDGSLKREVQLTELRSGGGLAIGLAVTRVT